MKKYSCLTMPYGKRYYITHPWKLFKDWYHSIRDMLHRARYGWCYGDVWDFDNWFMTIAPEMLRYMAAHGSAYPGREPFTTPEKWHDWLHEMADLLESGTEEYQDAHNEFYDEYTKELLTGKGWLKEHIDENGNVHHILQPEQSELSKKYWARANELALQGEANVRRAMTLMGEHFLSIWD